MTRALALLTVSLLALAGNEIAHAGSTSSPYPSVEAAPAEAGPGVPSQGGTAVPALSSPTGDGYAPAVTIPSSRALPVQAGRASGEGAAAGPSEPDEDTPGDQPSGREPADEKPGEEKPGEEKPGEEKPGEEKPGDEKPGDEKPGDEKPVDEKPTDERPDDTAAGSTTADAATTAAELLGWGTPLPGSDEFDYTGPPNPAKWNVAGECWAGHAGNGKRCASRSTVDGSKLVQTGLANGDSAWIASKTDQRYGRWEARVRSAGDGPANGRQYHPLLIVWPTSNQWPQDGEYDFLENGAPGQECAESFIHYPHAPGAVQQEFVKEKDCGAPLSEWHDVAFEWTPEYVRGYIDGKKWFDLSGGAKGSRKNIQDMPSGHLTIQLDNFFGGGMQPASYEVDWVRIYGLR